MAKDLVNQLLISDPLQRISAENALKHPFFKGNGGSPETELAIIKDALL